MKWNQGFCIAGVMPFVFASVGCGMLATAFLCGGQDFSTGITDVPADVQYVVDNRAAFENASHPLTDIEVGTVIDEVEAFLDGCWGSIAVQDGMTAALVYKFDVAGGLFQVQEYVGLDGSIPLWDGLPAVFIRNRQITNVSDNQLAVEALLSDAALIEDDGTLRSDCLTAYAADVSVAEPITLTIDGEHMVTHENLTILGPTRYWTSFQCIEEEIE